MLLKTNITGTGMNHSEQYAIKQNIEKSAWIKRNQYQSLYQQSIDDPEGFWREQAKCIDWIKPFTKVKNSSFAFDDFRIRWFEDGTLNVSVNCLDRNLASLGDQVAIIWEPDEPTQPSKKLTYNDLYKEVCRFSNVLKSQGIKRGDRVTIYLPMIPEAVVVMLACTRIGAIHSVVFGGFSPESLAGRIIDCGSNIIITSDEGRRGGKTSPLKENVDKALTHKDIHSVEKVIIIQNTGASVNMKAGRDIWYHDLMSKADLKCEPEEMGAEDPLFILYTSGSTGKPKGVLHTTGGYLVFSAITHRYIFDYKPGEVYWCTADIGWVTGHTYSIYGPLCNGATVVLFEGIPNYPDYSRFWQVIDKHKVNIFYTAPTAIRALMREGNEPVLKTSRASLRILGTVGEPINPEAWQWYYSIVGNAQCPIVDTWWQTETGGILITPLPGAIDLKPGSATFPFFGIRPGIVDNDGKLLEGEAEGNLVILDSWPGIMRSVFGDHERFIKTYFTTFKGMYTTGDGAKRDRDGYYWITGRVDDVINVSGHRLGTAEIESALDSHPLVAESAVVGYPHEIKGQGIYAYVLLVAHAEPSDLLMRELIDIVRKEIGSIAKPDIIQWASNLPRTRSGKIMRRILRKIAAKEFDSLGDTSTLTDPSVVETLINDSLKMHR
jgi:acetyl-CoA synthetase